MDKKRSIGVTIFGILTIAGGLISVFSFFDSKSFLTMFIRPWGMILYVLLFPLAVLEIILGVNIFKLKEWAREYLVVLSVFYIITL